MSEQSDQRHRPRRSQRWPRNQQRERVLRLVRDHDGVVDAAELAGRMGLHVTTARFHLDALCDEGTITRTRIKRASVGRPRTGYIAVRDRLDYRSLAEVLALELGDTVAERRERAERAGHRWATRILATESLEADGADGADETHGVGGVSSGRDTAEAPDVDIDDRTETITEVFNRMGFDSELEPAADTPDGGSERTIRLYGCPVRELARTHPEVSCAMHLGLLRGLLGTPTDAEGGATLRAELDPFVEPNLCIARVITND